MRSAARSVGVSPISPGFAKAHSSLPPVNAYDPLQTLIVTIAEPIALAVEADGSLVVVDGVLDAVVRVHPTNPTPTTGHHTLVSGLGRGTGAFVGFPAGIAVAPDGGLMVTYDGVEAGAVVRVDPITGDRTVLSGCAVVDDSFKCTSLIGAGHPLDFPSDIAVEADGDLVVTDQPFSCCHPNKCSCQKNTHPKSRLILFNYHSRYLCPSRVYSNGTDVASNDFYSTC
jgi:sugar lactone lactonase YvrE